MIDDDWPAPGFRSDPGNPEELSEDGTWEQNFSSVGAHEESLALGQEEPFYRRKSRIIWFREGVNGLAKGWEDLEFKTENLADFATAFQDVYYSGYGAFSDTTDPDFYYLRQGDVIVGQDSKGVEVVALVGEVEPNARGSIQKPVPEGKYSFSINMKRSGTYSSFVLTFLNQSEACHGPCPETNQYSLGGSESWEQASPPTDYCGVTFNVVTDISAVASPYGGHTMTVKKRLITLNDCGDIVEIGAEASETVDLDDV